MIPTSENIRFEEALVTVRKLADDFRANLKHYLSPGYQESEVRKDFIDKFLIGLGWDVNHDRQKNPFQQEVKVERGVSMLGAQRRADYAFYIGPNFRDVRFFVEAKKPFGDIATADNCFQAIRYGWNAQTPLVVLTDFEQFHILDCRYKPDIKTAVGHIVKKYHFEDYASPDKYAEIYFLFSRDAVASNSLEQYAGSLPKRRGKAVQSGLFKGGFQSIDESFLLELDEYRDALARGFKNKNPQFDGELLTEITQRVIDRLVFIRFLEDKMIQPDHLLSEFGDKGTHWQDFLAASRRLDGFCNGIVFKKHDILDSPAFKVDEAIFADICEKLAHVNSPYDFNTIPIHILGSIYERFLGKVITTTAKRVRVEEKPEVRKAGGVYYTPEYVVRYIVDQTVGKLIEGKSPAQIAPMRFADIACGSGSFLLGVFDLLLRYHRDWYNANPAKARKDGCEMREDGVWHLSLAQRRAILLNNIHGVDIDFQAVEVAQLSLYLKLLEEETTASARAYQLEFRETLLPPLNKNIVCGNSLIGTDILQGHLFERVEERKLNPMDFEQRFPEIMKRGGFDAIVGNPPYIRIQTLQETAPQAVSYFGERYRAAGKGNYDIYVVFAERALSLLNATGLMGYILPHKFFNAQYGAALRALIAGGRHLSHIVHFGHQQVFDGASTYTCLMFLSRAAAAQCSIVRVNDLQQWRAGVHPDPDIVPARNISAGDWIFPSGKASALLDKLARVPDTLGGVSTRIFQGIKTSADKIYIVEEIAREAKRVKVYSPHLAAERWLEPDLLHPLVKGGDSKRYHLARTNRLILFPYARKKKNAPASLIPEAEFKKRYPKTWAYLCENRRYLENRESGRMRGHAWHAYGRKQALDVMPLPKIFTPDLAARASFSLDESGEVFFTGGVAGGYGILLRDELSPKFCLALLNSRLLEWIVGQTATQMRGGYFSFEARFIRSLPMRICNLDLANEKALHDRLISLVDQIVKAKRDMAETKGHVDRDYYENKCAGLDRQIDALVYQLYDLTPDEIRIVEGA